MLNTAKTIAEYFRQSVSFDFSKDISSYAQILNFGDAFYTLTDREAFNALLNDCLSHDNKLVDIFSDLYDAECGIQKFAIANNRKMARSVAALFLQSPKYAYHKNEIAKVYLAINVWLLFFGAAEISPEWEKCPFCGKPVSGGVCTDKACKCTVSYGVEAMSKLSNMLTKERTGVKQTAPVFWDKIKTGSEFYIEYKKEILDIWDRREQEENAVKEKIKAEKIASAVAVVNALHAKVDLEAAKEKPDFDGVLNDIAKSAEIKEAVKYSDGEFTKRLEALKKSVSDKKEERNSRLAASVKKKDFDKLLNDFVIDHAKLESELKKPERTAAEIKSLLAGCETAHAKIILEKNRNAYKISKSDEDSLDRYSQVTAGKIKTYLSDRELSEKLHKQLLDLGKEVNLMLLELRAASASDNKSDVIKRKFEEKIEKNDRFNDLRKNRRAQYNESVAPVREALANLITKENEYKQGRLSSELADLNAEISRSGAQNGKSGALRQRLKSIEDNPFYASIATSETFTGKVGEARAKLKTLETAEYSYGTAVYNKRKKRKRIGIALSIVIPIFLVLCCIGIFIGELAGVFPKIVLAPIAKGIKGRVDDSKVIITGVDDGVTSLEIPESARISWQFTEKTVAGVDDGAFKGNTALEALSLPKTVASIGAEAFCDCTNLKSLIISAETPPTLGENAFDGCLNISIYVMPEVYFAYAGNAQWRKYEDYIFPYYANTDSQVTVLFDLDGGKADSLKLMDGLYGIGSISKGNPLTNYTCERYGYVFGGWQNRDGVKVTAASQNLKLKAVWSPATAYAHFIYNGATGGSGVTQKGITYGYALGELPEPVRTGYTFDGWYQSPDFTGKKVTATTVFEGETDVNYYAKWVNNVYSITFDYQDGGKTAVKEVTYDEAIGVALPDSAEKDGGNTFGGWWTAEGGAGELYTRDTVYKIDGDLTLYAKWTTRIILDVQKGAAEGGVTQIDTVYNSLITGLPSAERDGYEFDGWWTDIGGGGSRVANDYKFNYDGEITVYAKWKTTVYFNPHGGSVDVTQKEVVYNSPYGALPEPFKSNTKFGGWYLSEDFTVSVTESSIYLEDGSVTLHARWFVTLIFDYDGATDNCSTEYIFALDGQVIGGGVLPEPTKTGNKFGGWFSEKNGQGLQFTASTVFSGSENMIIHAYWILEVYSLVFDTLGGNEIEAITVSYNQALGELPVPVREGHYFAGWHLANEEDKFTAEFVPDLGDYPESGPLSPIPVTLTAAWIRESYKLIFNASEGAEVDPVTIAYGDELETVPVSLRAGYHFDGWYYDIGGEKLTTGIMPDLGDYPDDRLQNPIEVKLTAKWTVERYLVSFVTFSSDQYDAVEVAYRGEVVLTGTPERRGYIFDGWRRSYSDGNGSGEKITFSSVGDLGDYATDDTSQPIPVTAYAAWIKITATFYGSGTQLNPYKIFADYQLRDLADQVNGGNDFGSAYFELQNDISDIGDWTPIGNNNHDTYYAYNTAATSRRFGGHFDGKNHEISGYSVSADKEKYTDTYSGLFGYIAYGGVVENLTVSNFTVSGTSTRSTGSKGGAHHGAIAGLSSGVIRNCTVASGTVTGVAALDTHHGGVVGYIYYIRSYITDCVNNARVEGVAGRCNSHGGIVGSVNNGVVYNCTNGGRVDGVNNKTASYANGVKGYVFLGGIAGVSCAVIVKCSSAKDIVAGGGWSYNGVNHSGSGAIVGYLHNGSDADTQWSTDDTLQIDKNLYGDKYYCGVVNCTAQNTHVGFVQNDSGNGKRPVAISTDIDYRSLSGPVPAKISTDYFNNYLTPPTILKLLSDSALTIPSSYLVNDNVSGGQTGVWERPTNLPAESEAYIILIVGGIFGISGAVIITVALIKSKRNKRKSKK